MPCDQLLSQMLSITSAHAEEQQPRTTFAALESALSEVVGHKLLTVLAVLPDERFVERVYSGPSSAYPVGGTKLIDSTPRLKKVLSTAEAYIGRNRKDIASNYPDAETIFATGCSSILNVPVVWSGKVVATVNLLHDEEHYREEHVPIVQCLAQAAMPALLHQRLELTKYQKTSEAKEHHHV
jgi:hypothetical protein